MRHEDFRRYLTARLAGAFGAQMLIVALGYQVYQLTRNPLDLGLIGLSQFLPFVVLVLPAGQAADHFDRRRIMSGCYALLTVCALFLAALTLAGLPSAWPIFAVMTLFGVARAFSMPTGQALLPNLVPTAEFGNAIAVTSSTGQIATIAGPALGGLLFLAGPAVVYGVVAVMTALGTVLLLGVHGGGRSERVREPISLRTVLSGVVFVRSHPVVLGSISLDLFAVLFGGATALLPIYASDILHVGPTGLGVLRSAPAVGAAICAGVLVARPVARHVGAWMFGGVAVFGASTLVFGISRSFPLTIAALVVLGAADQVSVYVRHLLVQLTTPDTIRGRVSAVNAVFIGASNELGEFESGVTAAWFGTVPAVLVGGVATIVVAGAWSWLFPSLRTLQRFPGQASRTEPSGITAEALTSLEIDPLALDAPIDPMADSGSARSPE
jgi:predicted MFS family arabinose efflux permease